MNNLVLTAVWLACTALVGCSQPAMETSDTGLAGPLIIEMNPSGRAPLAGVARFTTTQPVTATITVTDDAGRSFEAVSAEDPATDHEIVLLGFRANRDHDVSLSLESADGTTQVVATVNVGAPELSLRTPPIEVTVFDAAAVEPGFTIIPMFRWLNALIDQTQGQILIIDDRGEIVWQYLADHSLFETKQLESGNLLYMQFDRSIVEIDMLGNVIREWHAAGTKKTAPDGSIPVQTDTFHHDMLVLPSGNLLALSTEVREIENWYTSEQDPNAPRETRDVIGDVLVEFQPDGTVIHEWKFFDLIDPYRIGGGSLNSAFYEAAYADILDEPAPDWTHSNGIDYDPETNSVLVSSNHLSTVFNLDMTTGELLWMFGDPRDWDEPWNELLLEPTDENMIWSYHHHAPKWTPAGTLLLFDNGAVRSRPFEPPLSAADSFSRAVEYEIDADAGSLTEVWSYGGPGDEIFLSAYISDADWLPETGNILVTKGGRVREKDGTVLMFPEEGHNWITITEVTHTSPAEKVWEAVLDDPRWGMAAFRTDRIASLYWGE